MAPKSISSSGVCFLFVSGLSSLLAARRDKRMRRGLLVCPEPSEDGIGQSTFLVSRHIGLTVCFFLDVFQFYSEPHLRVHFPHHLQFTDISLISKLRRRDCLIGAGRGSNVAGNFILHVFIANTIGKGRGLV